MADRSLRQTGSPGVIEGCGFAPLAAQVHRLRSRFSVHLRPGVPHQAVGQGLTITGSPWRCDEIAHPNSTCAWNTDMCGVNPGHPGAFDWYRAWVVQLAACGVDAVTVDDIAAPNGKAAEIALRRTNWDVAGRPRGERPALPTFSRCNNWAERLSPFSSEVPAAPRRAAPASGFLPSAGHRARPSSRRRSAPPSGASWR